MTDTSAENDTHYLHTIRDRLESLYAASSNDPRLREQLSDEVDWIDVKLAKAPALRSIPARATDTSAGERLAERIGRIDRLLEREEHDAGYQVYVLVRKIWPELKAAALRSPTPAMEREGVERILNDNFWTGEPGEAEAIKSATNAILALANQPAPIVSVKPMRLSDGRTDFFVSIRVGEREVTPHVFREEYKAAYHVALYDWLLNGSRDKPSVVEFGPDDWPALASTANQPAPEGRGD